MEAVVANFLCILVEISLCVCVCVRERERMVAY